MMQAQATDDRIREFIVKHFPLARKHELKASEKWLETGLIDSLGILDLVHFLEKEFSIHVSDEELLPENFESLDAVAAFTRSKQSGDSLSGN
jgi:acyl carrier protein